MSRDRSFRSLDYLRRSAATSRVLNLWQIAQSEGGKLAYEKEPLFLNTLLNRSIILKHRVRGSEADFFEYPMQIATKILLPIAESDLRSGARFVFLGQRNFDEVASESFGDALKMGSRDRTVLEILASLPSLDPFLMRESLKTSGFTAAPCYFNISEGDMQRMLGAARAELEPLVRMSFGNAHASGVKAATLLSKILSDANSAELEPLRRVMNMDVPAFREGIFCWKAFLYYKWQLRDLLPRLRATLEEVAAIRPTGTLAHDEKAYISRVKGEIRGWIFAAVGNVTDCLAIYDRAYVSLTEQSDPAAFRDFLMRAPAMFRSMGERLSSIEHVTSFWRFRFPPGQLQRIAAEELIDIFMDFEASLHASIQEYARV